MLDSLKRLAIVMRHGYVLLRYSHRVADWLGVGCVNKGGATDVWHSSERWLVGDCVWALDM